MRSIRAVLVALMLCGILSCAARPSPHAEALSEMTLTARETTALLRKVHSPEDARQVQAQVGVLIDRAQSIQAKMKSLVGQKIPLEATRETRAKLEENQAALAELGLELNRLNKDPAIRQVFGESLKRLSSSPSR